MFALPFMLLSNTFRKNGSAEITHVYVPPVLPGQHRSGEMHSFSKYSRPKLRRLRTSLFCSKRSLTRSFPFLCFVPNKINLGLLYVIGLMVQSFKAVAFFSFSAALIELRRTMTPNKGDRRYKTHAPTRSPQHARQPPRNHLRKNQQLSNERDPFITAPFRRDIRTCYLPVATRTSPGHVPAALALAADRWRGRRRNPGSTHRRKSRRGSHPSR